MHRRLTKLVEVAHLGVENQGSMIRTVNSSDLVEANSSREMDTKVQQNSFVYQSASLHWSTAISHSAVCLIESANLCCFTIKTSCLTLTVAAYCSILSDLSGLIIRACMSAQLKAESAAIANP